MVCVKNPLAPGTATVLIVEDHPVFRNGLARYLEQEGWVAAVLEVGNVEEALSTAVASAVDVIVMDLVLPDGNGLTATRQIVHARPAVRVMVLTADESQSTVGAALDAGASGYCLKRSEPEDIALALHAVWRGGRVFGPMVESDVRKPNLEGNSAVHPPFDRLAERELEIVSMMAAGLSTAKIARTLGIAEHTVRNQMRPIYDKLGVSDRVQCMVLAASVGLLWPRK